MVLLIQNTSNYIVKYFQHDAIKKHNSLYFLILRKNYQLDCWFKAQEINTKSATQNYLLLKKKPKNHVMDVAQSNSHNLNFYNSAILCNGPNQIFQF